MTRVRRAEPNTDTRRRAWAKEVLRLHWHHEGQCIRCGTLKTPVAWPCMPARTAGLLLGLPLTMVDADGSAQVA